MCVLWHGSNVVGDYIFSIFRVEKGEVGWWYGHGSKGSQWIVVTVGVQDEERRMGPEQICEKHGSWKGQLYNNQWCLVSSQVVQVHLIVVCPSSPQAVLVLDPADPICLFCPHFPASSHTVSGYSWIPWLISCLTLQCNWLLYWPVVLQNIGNHLPDDGTQRYIPEDCRFNAPTFLNHRFREKYIFHIPVLWVMTCCAKVDVNEHFRGTYCHVIFSLKMEVVCYSETFVPTCKTVWCQTQEDHSVNLHCHENCTLRYFVVFRFFGIPMDLLPEIRSSSEIYGCLADGSLQGVPISGVTRSRCIEFVKMQIMCLHKVWITAEHVIDFSYQMVCIYTLVSYYEVSAFVEDFWFVWWKWNSKCDILNWHNFISVFRWSAVSSCRTDVLQTGSSQEHIRHWMLLVI